jgi:hypothetical protein
MSGGRIAGREPRDLLPLSAAVLNTLLALAGEERHGYGIMREVERRTKGRTRMGPGVLYGSIKCMLADGLIEESDQRPDPAMDDPRRRYHRVSTEGIPSTAERPSGAFGARPRAKYVAVHRRLGIGRVTRTGLRPEQPSGSSRRRCVARLVGAAATLPLSQLC